MNLRDKDVLPQRLRGVSVRGGLIRGMTYEVREVFYETKEGKRVPCGMRVRSGPGGIALYVKLDQYTSLVWKGEDDPSHVNIDCSDDGVVILTGINQ